jgi:hypothetical protein
MDATFLIARRDATMVQITSYEAAVAALQDPTVEEYVLDTGQSQQRVRRADIARVQAVLDSLYNRYAILTQRIDGPQGTVAAPDW